MNEADVRRDVARKLADHGLTDCGGDWVNPDRASLATAGRIVAAVTRALDSGQDEAAVATSEVACEQRDLALLPDSPSTGDVAADVVDIVVEHRATEAPS